MERVEERSYSYRPNSRYPDKPNPRLIPRLARVPEYGVEMLELWEGIKVRVPRALELLPEDLAYDRYGKLSPPRYQFDPPGRGGARYRGGLGAGVQLNSKRRLHNWLLADPGSAVLETIPDPVRAGYLHTLRHLTDLDSGHFSNRHPDVPNRTEARSRILAAAAKDVFSPGDLVWVEWDTTLKQIVSIGWHYYYRWAYQDTVRLNGWTNPRPGLHPLAEEVVPEKTVNEPPKKLSSVRRLFGYTGDNKGSKGIGTGDYSQMIGRIAINAALEVISEGERFLPTTYLKELGMPRPSAVEFYLKQRFHPNRRPSDSATLETYGDAAGYDTPGRLCGRKFYLDRADDGKPWQDDDHGNERSTVAIEASQPHRHFRFTLRFHDLDGQELAAVLLAFCPHQFRNVAREPHAAGYCSKLGYARPLGWGTVRIEAKGLYFLKKSENGPRLEAETDIGAWFSENFIEPAPLEAWLKVHRSKNPDAGDYPKEEDRHGDKQIYTYHSKLRADHALNRRYT